MLRRTQRQPLEKFGSPAPCWTRCQCQGRSAKSWTPFALPVPHCFDRHRLPNFASTGGPEFRVTEESPVQKGGHGSISRTRRNRRGGSGGESERIKEVVALAEAVIRGVTSLQAVRSRDLSSAYVRPGS